MEQKTTKEVVDHLSEVLSPHMFSELARVVDEDPEFDLILSAKAAESDTEEKFFSNQEKAGGLGLRDLNAPD